MYRRAGAASAAAIVRTVRREGERDMTHLGLERRRQGRRSAMDKNILMGQLHRKNKEKFSDWRHEEAVGTVWQVDADSAAPLPQPLVRRDRS